MIKLEFKFSFCFLVSFDKIVRDKKLKELLVEIRSQSIKSEIPQFDLLIYDEKTKTKVKENNLQIKKKK